MARTVSTETAALIRNLKARLKGSAYRFTAKSVVSHGDGHAVDCNFDGTWFCHTCSVAGV
jgi:hypothetical protein